MNENIRILHFVVTLFFVFISFRNNAELVECSQVNQNGNIDAPGGCIGKSLSDQIGSGYGDHITPGSSVYLIKRDPARSIRRGRQLFQRKFTIAEGLGPRVNSESRGDITEVPILGAGLADSCGACHGRPRGSAGHGGDVATRPDSRDAPHLFGLGIVEQLADEMTRDLRNIRSQAISEATGSPQEYSARVTRFPAIPGNALILTPTQTKGDETAVVSEIRLLGEDGNKLDIDFTRVYSHSESANFSGDKSVDGNANTFWQSDKQHSPIPSSKVALYLFWEEVKNVAGIVYLSRQDGNDSGSINRFVADIAKNPVKSSDWQRAETTQFTDDIIFTLGDKNAGPVTKTLVSKSIHFGEITVSTDGTVDNSKIQGVDEDLRIRPFFAEGTTASMREFIIGAFKAEMGLESWDPVLCAVTDPQQPKSMTSPAGFKFDPTLDNFERPPICAATDDNDEDGVIGEIDPALVNHLEFYLLNYFKPGTYKISRRSQRGLRLMKQAGCTSCHTQNLTINHDRRVADVTTKYNPNKGIFNQLFSTITPLMMEVSDEITPPQLLPKENSFTVENFFSDLKRHDLGPSFHERNYDGSQTTHFVTEPLWGVGTTAPYGHDGRSINLDAVIRRHGGEATRSRENYARLNSNDQLAIEEFLQSLVLFPPDDTASELNPGDPLTNDPQSPGEHGSIDLSPLFTIPSEGGE